MVLDMIQNSLEHLIDGMISSLRDIVLPEVGDPYARAQVTACIELLGNIGTRVAWDPRQLTATADAADDALAAAIALVPDLADALGPPVDQTDPLVRRDAALARVGTAIRWCSEHEGAEPAAARLRAFATWHLEAELARLRTGMYSS